ncbi:hypothetical protein BH10ACI1_BH10ACI1_30160 [soil metagenome]
MLKEIPKLISRAIFAVTFIKLFGPLGIPIGLMLSEQLMESLGDYSEEFFKKLGEETGLALAESNDKFFGFLKGKVDSAGESAPDYTLARLLAKVWEERLNNLINSKNFDDAEFKKQTNLLKKWRDKFKEAQDENKLYTFYEIFPKETSSDFAIQQKAFDTITNQTDAENNLWANLKRTLEKWTGEDEQEVFKTLENEVRKALTDDLQDEILVHLNDNQVFRDSFETMFEFFVTEQLKKQGKTGEDTNKIVKQLSKKLNEALKLLKNPPKPQPLPKYIAADGFPSPTNFFTGRGEVIEGIKKEFENSKRATLHGISGLGKTSVLLEFARRAEDDYKHIIFLRAAKGNAVSSFARIAERLDETVKKLEKDSDKAAIFKTWLEENDGWLLLIDNVDEPSEVLPLLPVNLHGDILSTGNSPTITILGNEVEIKKMTSKSGELLLYRRAKTLSDLEDAELKSKLQNESEAEQISVAKIVKEFDGLPLALNLAGAYIHKFNKTFAEYENLYEKSAHKLLEKQDINDQYQNNSVALAFSLAFETIAKPENESSEAKQIAETAILFLKTASFLNPEAIPLEIFTEMLAKQSESAKEQSQDELFLDEVFAKIAQFDLFEKDNDKNTVNIHRLVLKVINNKIEADEKQIICSQILDILADLMPEYDYYNKKACERYFRQTETALENSDKLPLENADSNFLYYLLGYFQRLSGNYQLAEKFFEQNLKISENVYGKEHEETATSLNNLANVYDLQGRYDEAIVKFEEASVIDEKTVGKEHPKYATRLNNLAMVYYSQGRYDGAIEKYEEALAIDEKTIGKEHPEYAIRLNNLAMVYYSQGRYDEAIVKFEEAKEITAKTIGKEHPTYAIRLNNLAMVYQSQGRYDEAIVKFEEAVQIFVNRLGESHPSTQGVKENLKICRNRAKGE